MTLVPAAAILVARRDARGRARAVLAYLAITHLGGAGVWIALLALAAPGALGRHGPDARRDRRADRLRHQGGPRAAAQLAAARAPGRARAVLGADVGVMVKVALYGLIRVEFEWLGTPPRWLGFALLAPGLLSALGGVLWALVQPDLKRLLAFSSIENVGIVVLGARRVDPARRDPVWAALRVRRGAAAHRQPRRVQGAAVPRRGRVRARDRRRSTSTGSAGCCAGCRGPAPRSAVGCLAIAGLPPLNGFASEWLTLQSLAHLAFDAPAGVGLAGAAALAGVAATAALALLCFVKVAGLVLLGPPRTRGGRDAVEAPLRDARRAAWCSPRCASSSGSCPGAAAADARRARAGRPSASPPSSPALDLPGTGSLPDARARRRARSSPPPCSSALRGTRRAAPAPTWACGQPLVPRAGLDVGRRSPSRCGSCSRRCCGRGATLEVVREGGVVQRIHYPRASLAGRPAALPARDPRRAGRRRARAPAADRQRAHLRRLPAGARARPAGARPRRSARMSAAAVAGRSSLAPLLPGTIQALKARAAGPARRVAAAALPDAAAAVGQERGRSRAAPAPSTASRPRWSPPALLAALAAGARRRARRRPRARPRRVRARRRCWRSRASRSPPPPGTPATASR